MNKRQKKKRLKLTDYGFSSWKDKRKMDKGYRGFLNMTRHSKPRTDFWERYMF